MPNDPKTLIESLNESFDQLHKEKEELFWLSKMGLSSDFAAYSTAEKQATTFSQDPQNLKNVKEALSLASENDQETLKGWENFFLSHVIEDPEARKIKYKIIEKESALAEARKRMPLSYQDPLSNDSIPISSVKLGLKLSSDDNEDVRKACFGALESIEPFLLDHGFIEIIRLRNALAKKLGYPNFYAYKLMQTEQISMEKLFGWLDSLEEKTRQATQKLVASLVSQKGSEAAKPWNFRYFTQGDTIKAFDPYMPFSHSILRWGKSFAAMGVDFSAAELQLDLMDRKGKYENGFCHAPVAPYQKNPSERIRAKVNFTSNAVPKQLGSGYQALVTLFHEGGHAAHFSNICMGAPCFSQEFAPTSVAMAETQSMFFDSLLSDSDWLHRYAQVPWSTIQEQLKATHPLRVMTMRQMLIIPYVERKIYEMDDHELSASSIIETCKDVEKKMTFLERSPRPTLAVPHLLETESSAYYHGYILAECAVEQTRQYFLKRDQHIVDNPKVGPELNEKYWKKGNSIPFEAFIQDLTGRAFSVEDLVDTITKPVDQILQEQKQRLDYLQNIPPHKGPIDLNVHLKLVHGNTLIASTESRNFEGVASTFEEWLDNHYS